MAIIPQKYLFDYKEIENLLDLERLLLIINYLPDEKLMRKLISCRGNGRNDYPVRAMWNSILAGIVYQHPSIEMLRRDLSRNGQLRDMCGFDPLRLSPVPTANAYTNFLKLLIEHEQYIDDIFTDLVEKISGLLEGFGSNLAIDSKAINSRASRRRDGVKDLRGESDADRGVKTYSGKNKDGSAWKKIKSWFGFKLHLIVDSDYELPVAYSVSKASSSDVTIGKQMINNLGKERPQILENAELLTADKGYDDAKFYELLWNKHSVKPVVDIRKQWQITGELRALPDKEHLYYNQAGTIHCKCQETGEIRAMQFAGFEKDRDTLKYRCPCKYQGVDCQSRSCCSIGDNVRIDIHQDIRRFCPVPHESAKFKSTYKKRSSVERVNSRIAESFCFDKHYIRGLAKMRVRCGLALLVMLGMAYGRIKQKQEEHIRSLVKAVA